MTAAPPPSEVNALTNAHVLDRAPGLVLQPNTGHWKFKSGRGEIRRGGKEMGC